MSELALLHSNDQTLARRLADIDREFQELAILNLHGTTEGASGPEVLARLEFDKLRMTAGLDLLTVMTRGRVLEKISSMQLWQYLPGSFSTEEEAIEIEGKLSRSVQSNIKDLYNIVFPYVQNVLGISISEFWESMTHSNLREIIPYLKAAITDAPSKRDTVNQAIDQIKDEILSLPESTHPEDLKRAVAETIIVSAQSNTTTGLREALRPGDNEAIPALVLRRNRRRYLIAMLTEDDFAVLLRRNQGNKPLFNLYFPQAEIQDECRILTRVMGDRYG